MAQRKDDHGLDATRYMLEDLEKALYAGREMVHAKQTWALRELLSKLGIKSAKNSGLVYGGPLQMESLSATLKQVTFDSKHLKLWKKGP